jgi:hypothetical protein
MVHLAQLDLPDPSSQQTIHLANDSNPFRGPCCEFGTRLDEQTSVTFQAGVSRVRVKHGKR